MLNDLFLEKIFSDNRLKSIPVEILHERTLLHQ